MRCIRIHFTCTKYIPFMFLNHKESSSLANFFEMLPSIRLSYIHVLANILKFLDLTHYNKLKRGNIYCATLYMLLMFCTEAFSNEVKSIGTKEHLFLAILTMN